MASLAQAVDGSSGLGAAWLSRYEPAHSCRVKGGQWVMQGELAHCSPHRARTVGVSVFLLCHLHGSPETRSLSWAKAAKVQLGSEQSPVNWDAGSLDLCFFF